MRVGGGSNEKTRHVYNAKIVRLYDVSSYMILYTLAAPRFLRSPPGGVHRAYLVFNCI
jgi:hypothetical protein